MKYKYNKKLGLFIRHSKTVGDGRVDLSAELKRENYGSKCFIKRNAKRWNGRPVYSDVQRFT